MSSVKDQPHFCPIPFLQLQLNPMGRVSACCFSNEYTVGEITKNSIAEIWNGPKMQQWRNEFISGDIQICKNAMRSFECHKNYRHLTPLADPIPVQTRMPRRLDLRLNGKCNLQCIMCDVWRQPNGLYDQSDFWTLGPTKIFPYLVEIDMLGGEPFIQKDTYRLIDEVAKVNTACTWGFITNGAYIFNEKIEEALDRISIRHIHISLDSVHKETYEKIRKNGSFERVFATIQSFAAYRAKRLEQGRPFTLFASMCVQAANCFEISDFLDFCAQYQIQPILQAVIGREHLSLNRLPISDLQKIQELVFPYLDTEQRGAVLPVYQQVSDLLKLCVAGKVVRTNALNHVEAN